MIITRTALEAWKQSLATILKRGMDFMDENNRMCRELLNFGVQIKNPEQDITRPMQLLNTFGNWKYPPFDEIAKVMLANKLAPDYSYSYGPRLFNFQGKINQINDFIIPLLKEIPNSRRAVLSLWDPKEDSNVMKRDIPGLVMIDLKLRENRLNLTAVIRSNDFFFGWPANIYQIYVLQDYVRKKLGCDAGSITTFSTSAHIFHDQFGYIKKILKK
ncbi:MAG: thymidylate synthase [Candidatus Woesearchaeota archaeon]